MLFLFYCNLSLKWQTWCGHPWCWQKSSKVWSQDGRDYGEASSIISKDGGGWERIQGRVVDGVVWEKFCKLNNCYMRGLVKGVKLCFRYPYLYFRHGESTATASQLTSPASQKSKDLKVFLLLQDLGRDTSFLINNPVCTFCNFCIVAVAQFGKKTV